MSHHHRGLAPSILSLLAAAAAAAAVFYALARAPDPSGHEEIVRELERARVDARDARRAAEAAQRAIEARGGDLSHANARSALVLFLDHGEAEVRRRALELLDRLGEEKALAPAMRLARKDPDREVQTAALLLVARYSTAESLAALGEALGSEDPQLRAAAAGACSRSKNTVVFNLLRGALAEEIHQPQGAKGDEGAASAMVVALASSGRREAVGPVVSAAGVASPLALRAAFGHLLAAPASAGELVRRARELPPRGAAECRPLEILLYVLVKTGRREGGALALEALDAPDASLAAAARFVLPKLVSKDLAGPLAERLLREAGRVKPGGDASKALVLVEAIRRAPSAGAGAALVACVASKNERLALRAAAELAHVRAHAETAELVKLHNAMPEGPIRRALAVSLRRGGYRVIFDAKRKTFRVRP